MRNLYFYTHGGSENHGCEAIAYTLKNVLKQDVTLFSANPQEDEKYSLAECMNIRPDRQKFEIQGLKKFVYKVNYKLSKNEMTYYKEIYKDFIKNIDKDGLYISIGGDNYCYNDNEWLDFLNFNINEKGAKTALIGCSIDADALSQKVIDDLNRYSLIVARETYTYQLLKNRLSTHVEYAPDTAFLLPKSEDTAKELDSKKNYIGINVSPLVIRKEEKEGIIINNYCKVIKWILDNTSSDILLIPHVVWSHNDDRIPLKQLYEKFASTGRVHIIEDQSAIKLKQFISQCEFFIGARTHATIAAYSTSVPTLVTGYSVKARGIAYDLFGNEDYVISINDLKGQDDLLNKFKPIYEEKEKIRKDLNVMMEEYKMKIRNIKEWVSNI